MEISKIIQQKHMSKYRIAKNSGIPYATLNDICNGKTHLEKCSAETIYRLAHALDMTMEDLLAPYMIKRPSFENFKSAVCHRVKDQGDLDFIIDTLKSQDIRTYYEREWYPECLYLLAMLDYLSRENDVPLCSDYDDLRHYKLDRPIYPSSLIALAAVLNDENVLKQAAETAIPEFVRFNIIESDVRNVF